MSKVDEELIRMQFMTMHTDDIKTWVTTDSTHAQW